MRASWAAQVTDACNAVRAAGFAGTMVRDGAGAFGNAPLPENKRNRRGAHIDEPWTFSCSESTDENTQETTRTGGWTNCRLQMGYDINWGSPDLALTNVIAGTDTVEDGAHYLEVILSTDDETPDSAEIKRAENVAAIPASDYITGKIRICLGTVTDGVLSGCAHINPVIYKYV